MDPLVITIKSFGFHVSGPPQDDSGHGGGFVFDCRGLPNPGREERFRRLTGQDQEVQNYLQQDPGVREFLDHACALVLLTAQNYKERGFSSLIVHFGCTGGQHRSVYCAEQLANRISKAGFTVRLIHIDKPDFA